MTGKALGGHAVKIIGWGIDHWIVVNSWNDSWGDKGTFRIAFGNCGIDSDCTAGLAWFINKFELLYINYKK